MSRITRCIQSLAVVSSRKSYESHVPNIFCLKWYFAEDMRRTRLTLLRFGLDIFPDDREVQATVHAKSWRGV